MSVVVSTYAIAIRNGLELTPTREIDRADYEALLRLNEELAFYRDFDRAWRILHVNLTRQKEIMMQLKAAFDDPSKYPELADGELIQRALNVELFNVLSASYFYFSEYSQTNIVRKYGKDSEALSFLKATRSRYFDAYFEYRFFYKLRNYAVHCGLPIQIVRRVPIRRDGVAAEGFAIWFDCEMLLRSYDGWGRHVKNDLEGFDQLPVNSLVINFANIVFSLQSELDRYLRLAVRDSVESCHVISADLDFESNTYSVLEAAGSEHFEIEIAFNAIPRIMTDVPEFDLEERLINMSQFRKADA